MTVPGPVIVSVPVGVMPAMPGVELLSMLKVTAPPEVDVALVEG
jgi:hypothetical protein